MANEKETNRFDRLRKKFRLVAMDQSTFREKWSVMVSPWNIIVVTIAFAIVLMVLTYLLIAYTGLREYIPGFPDGSEQEQAADNFVRLKKVEHELEVQQQYTQNLLNILEGTDTVYTITAEDTNRAPVVDPDSIDFTRSEEDSLLREMMEEGNSYDFYSSSSLSGSGEKNMPGAIFFSPLNGEISQSFDESSGHYGVDIVAPEKEAIKATLDGIVILATWTSDAGNTIYVQHSNNLISVYKHNSMLLKRAGDKVKAGEPIAIIGNTGELSTGAHLQFELWQNGTPLDPQEYVGF